MKKSAFMLKSGLTAAAPFIAQAQSTPRSTPRRGAGMTQWSHQGGLLPLDGGKIGNTPAMKITDIKTFLVSSGGPSIGST